LPAGTIWAQLSGLTRNDHRDRRLFPDTPLPFALLAAHDFDAALRVAQLRLRSGLEIAPLAVRVEARQGRATLQAEEMRIADGRASLSLEIDASTARPALRLKASGKDLSMEKLTAVRGRTRVTGGSTAFTLDYSGSGASPRALAASASGELQLSTGPARVGAGGLDFGGDLLVRLFAAINPFHAVDSATELHCAAARLPARAGVITVNRSIAYETRRANVVAAGRIDLRNETLDLVIRPTIKEGLGVGAGQLAQLVRVTGPMRSPGLALDAASALRAAATVGGAVATGGLSLIGEALLDRRTSDPSPCRTALAAGRGSPPGEDAAAAPASNPARRVIDGARRGAQRLFNLGR
ncbi:MAG: AsmA family protein, partial [Burkholderiales bacterium]|nr:AsmA family protein [Burkholderiales bacterium]